MNRKAPFQKEKKLINGINMKASILSLKDTKGPLSQTEGNTGDLLKRYVPRCVQFVTLLFYEMNRKATPMWSSHCEKNFEVFSQF